MENDRNEKISRQYGKSSLWILPKNNIIENNVIRIIYNGI